MQNIQPAGGDQRLPKDNSRDHLAGITSIDNVPSSQCKQSNELLHCDLYCAWYLFLYPKEVVLNLFYSKASHCPQQYSKGSQVNMFLLVHLL